MGNKNYHRSLKRRTHLRGQSWNYRRFKAILMLTAAIVLSSSFVSALLVSKTHKGFTKQTTMSLSSTKEEENQISFRKATAQDIPRCFEIESASYPSDEAATLKSLTYRQEHAGDYFLVCVKGESILGFVCATKCGEFTEDSMSSVHDPMGPLLAVHSVVVDSQYRRQGIATKMMEEYIKEVQETNEPIRSIVCIAKEHLLGFYVRCGFRVNRPSPIVHGKDLWYDLELPLETSIRRHPLPGESWFCKTERFKPNLSFMEDIKPHLEAHTQWVKDLRTKNVCIVSGYRVDGEGKPGGGGLMFVAAKSYEDAHELVSQNDPLIVHGCVDWELHGWIGQVGGISVE